MKYVIAAIIVIVLLLLFYDQYYKYSAWNTYGIRLCDNDAKSSCESYYVHKQHYNPQDAAKILAEVTTRSKTLIDFLKNKYVGPQYVSSGIDPDKNNRIDIIQSSPMYTVNDITSAMHNLLSQEYIQERVVQLMQNYDSDKIYEISPLNKDGNTSYTEDKARLVLCLREKEKNANGHNELHDINTIMFVVIHELSHMMNKDWGHPEGFWVLFKFMLLNATECGVYTPVNYSIYPIRYCGLLLTYNPLYDPRL